MLNHKTCSALPAELPDVLPEETETVIRRIGPVLPFAEPTDENLLARERKLYLEGEIDNGVLNIQRAILRFNLEDAGKAPEERQPIFLYIFSPGGEVDLMWSLVDTIEASETPVYTVNVGMAASASGLIFLAGHRRFMLRRSRVVIHEGSARMSGDAVKVMDAGESYRRLLRQVKDYILERTKITPAALNRQKCHDWELDAAYCLSHGVCDAVVEKLSEIL